VATGARLNPGNGDEGEGSTDDIATQTCRSKAIISTHTLIRSHRLHLPSATGIAAERQALPTVSTLYMELREAEYVGQAVIAPCAPQLGITSADIGAGTGNAAQRQRSTASSGPAALPSPLATRRIFFFTSRDQASASLCQLPLSFDTQAIMADRKFLRQLRSKRCIRVVDSKVEDVIGAIRCREPLCIRGLTDGWPARVNWSPYHKFSRKFGENFAKVRGRQEIAQTGGLSTASKKIKIKDLKGWFCSHPESMAFSTERGSLYSALREDFSVPSSVKHCSLHGTVSIGAPAAGLNLHRHSASWLALLNGQKAWCFLKASKAPQNMPPQPDINWCLEECAEDIVVCLQMPGDIIYVPPGHWHATSNITSIESEQTPIIGVGGMGPSPGLQWVVSEGDLDSLMAVTDRNLLCETTRTGKTLMHTACYHGHLHIAQ
jgi:hypothetical protein